MDFMEKLYPINLLTDPESWRLFSIRKNDPAFAPFSQQVLIRDEYTCRFCGFQAKKFQEVVNLDNNYNNNKLSNMVTACSFCAQCFFVSTIGCDQHGGGILIYCPEISQGYLNGFCHVLFCAMGNDTSYRVDAQNIYRSFKSRSQIIDSCFGEGVSDPAVFGRILIDAPEANKSRIVQEAFPLIRLLPSYTKFAKQVEVWSQDSLEELST